MDYESELPSSSFPLTTLTIEGYTSFYNYSDNSTCVLNPAVRGQSVLVEFVCDPFAVPARVTEVSIDYLACEHYAVVNSTYACPHITPSSPSSSSPSASPYWPTSSSTPMPQSSCANSQVDLSSLSTGNNMIIYNSTMSGFLVFHPCHAITTPDCFNSTLCVGYLNGTTEVLVGYDSNPSNYALSSFIPVDGTSYSYYLYQDESVQCDYEGVSYPRQALVLFYCNESVVDGAVLDSVQRPGFPNTIPCQWQVRLQTALACPLAIPSSTGSNNSFVAVSSTSDPRSSVQSTGSSPQPAVGTEESFNLNLVASFAVVLFSAFLLIGLLIVYRVRARGLLPHSSAVAMHSPFGISQAPNDSYARMA